MSALLTASSAVVEPGGLPTAARVLREWRRSRGRGKRRPGSMDRSCRGRHRAVAATAWPAAALPGKVLRRCGAIAVAPGVGDPPKGGCVGPRALRSCTTPDSPCPARASQRSPDREGALRWRPGPLCAPPTRADHAVPPGAAACRDVLRSGRRDHRCRPAAVRQGRVRRLPGVRHPGPRVPAPALRGLRARQAAGLQLQAAGVLPLAGR